MPRRPSIGFERMRPSATRSVLGNELPQAVSIREVGPRDGFQNEPEVIATERKVELIDALARTGLRRLEVTSFVRADVIPQLADAAEVLARIDVPAEVSVSVLIPNERGLDAALELRERRADARPSTRSTCSCPPRRPTTARTSTARSPSRWRVWRPCSHARARRGCAARAVISTSFGCPYEGHVPPERVLEIAATPARCGRAGDRLRRHHRHGQPAAGPSVLRRGAQARSGEDVELTAHFHNTRGQGLANVLAALEAGVSSFESSFGELGGCPVPAGATGNIATEDLVSMLHEMDIQTGIDLQALLACARRVQEVLGRPLGSHTLVAGPVDWHAL